MKRFAFISALLGIGAAKAQDLKAHERMQSFMARAGRKQVKPANGECPLCGTMAEPFMPSFFDAGVTFRRIDCAHCNLTFKQEPGK